MKIYFVEVVVKKYAPVAALTGIGYVVTFMLAHATLLEQYGITTGEWPLKMDSPSGMVTLIEWATLGTKTGAMLTVLVGVAIAAIQHHGTAAVTDKPQSGDMRQAQTPPQAVVGGDRSTDVPKGA